MDLLNLILQNTKDIKKLKKQIYCCGGGGGGGTVTDAQNGIHLDGTIVKLGGSLTEDTLITSDSYSKRMTFVGLTDNNASASNPNINNSFFNLSSSYDLSSADPQFGVTLGVSAPADGAGNAAILTNGGDYGIFVEGLTSLSTNTGIGIYVQNVTGIGIQINGTGASTGLQVAGASIGIQVSGNNNFAIKAVNNTTSIYSEVSDALGSYLYYGNKTGNLNVGSIEPLMKLVRTTGAVVPANSAVSIDLCAPQVGSGTANTIRLVAVNANQANNTSKFQVVGLNAGTETNLFTVDALLNGRIGIGSTITSPTARLHLPAGAAGAQSAPLKFSSGTNNTTPEAGSMEYNGTNLFFVRSGVTRETIFTGVSGATAPTTTAGTTITNFYGSAATNFLGDPNSWASVVINGTTYKVPLYT